MGKVTIYLPDELAEEVRAHDVPLSSVCQEALRKAVEHEQREAEARAEIDRIVDRLRATVGPDETRERREARALGIRWAKEIATFRELDEVTNIAVEHWAAFELDEEHSLVRLLADERGWWSKGVRGTAPFRRDVFTEAMLEAALDVYNEVAPRL